MVVRTTKSARLPTIIISCCVFADLIEITKKTGQACGFSLSKSGILRTMAHDKDYTDRESN